MLDSNHTPDGIVMQHSYDILPWCIVYLLRLRPIQYDELNKGPSFLVVSGFTMHVRTLIELGQVEIRMTFHTCADIEELKY